MRNQTELEFIKRFIDNTYSRFGNMLMVNTENHLILIILNLDIVLNIKMISQEMLSIKLSAQRLRFHVLIFVFLCMSTDIFT